MKTLKFLFALLIFSISIFACTPQALDDDQSNIIENIQATGAEDSNEDDGSKD
nr:hypothetical protein [uncultured Psychroserpens sp.]